jgi:hypothetical protein
MLPIRNYLKTNRETKKIKRKNYSLLSTVLRQYIINLFYESIPYRYVGVDVSEELAISGIYRDNGSVRSKLRYVFAKLLEVRCRKAVTFPFPL